MKKTLHTILGLILLTVFVCGVFTACGKSGTNKPITPPEMTYKSKRRPIT